MLSFIYLVLIISVAVTYHLKQNIEFKSEKTEKKIEKENQEKTSKITFYIFLKYLMKKKENSNKK